ncbi:MAG: hypothetical protein PF961_04425 [Planctomycetota bacterium]|jgi:hypothetical protein|nr:hypothetical protein [Planctomycetota bacterium]
MSVYRAQRLNEGEPIITRAMVRAAGGDEHEARNVNGPSLIKVPDWITPERRADPRARYYCYFAHHQGEYIRMAWAEDLTGPWQLYRTGVAVGEQRGVLDMDCHNPERRALGGKAQVHLALGLTMIEHLASPDVHVDDEQQRIVMYLHAPCRWQDASHGQQSFVATSADGLDFNGVANARADGHGLRSYVLGRPYLRVFALHGRTWAVSVCGELWLAPQAPRHIVDDALWQAEPHPGGERVWQLVPMALAASFQRDPVPAGAHDAKHLPRHVAFRLVGTRIDVFYSCRPDAPERIQLAQIDASEPDPARWQLLARDLEILAPEMPWEGAGILEPDGSIRISRSGSAEGVNQLRDPCLYEEEGRLYLLYTGCGEEAIGIAELFED